MKIEPVPEGYYTYTTPTANARCAAGIPDDIRCKSMLEQHGSEDDYRLTLVLRDLTEAKLLAIMTIVNALEVRHEYSEPVMEDDPI